MDLFSKCKELYEKIRYFEYGIPVDGVIKGVPSAEYYVKNYHFLKPEEFEKYKGGICWDYVEYERKFLEVNDIDFNQYYLITNTPPNYDTHTFITVKDGDDLIYIESSFKRVEHIIDGVQKFKSLEDIVKLITTNMWYCNDNDKRFDEFKYDVCKFKGHPQYGCTCQEYMDWMDNNSDIVIQDVSINPKKINNDELPVEEFSVNKIDTKFNQFVCESVNDPEEYDETLHDHIADEDDVYNESWVDSVDSELIMESQKRRDSYLKKIKYDPKTQTVDTGILDTKTGKNIRIKIKFDSSDPIGAYYQSARSKINEFKTENGYDLNKFLDNVYINMPKDIFNKKKNAGLTVFYHEIGHFLFDLVRYFRDHLNPSDVERLMKWDAEVEKYTASLNEDMVDNLNNHDIDAEEMMADLNATSKVSRHSYDHVHKKSLDQNKNIKGLKKQEKILNSKIEQAKANKDSKQLMKLLNEKDVIDTQNAALREDATSIKARLKANEELTKNLNEPIKEYAIQESWTDFKNGVHPSSGLMFHVSLKNDMDGKTITPQLPSYITDGGELDDNYQEDTKTKRLCVSPSIEGCLIAILSYKKIREHVGDKFYVYTPEKPFSQYKHKTNKEIVKDKLVFDANITKEAWILEPCKLKLYGIIKLKKVKDLKKKPTVEKGIKMNTIKLDYEWIMTPKASGKFNKAIGDSPDDESDKKEKPINEYAVPGSFYDDIKSHPGGVYALVEDDSYRSHFCHIDFQGHDNKYLGWNAPTGSELILKTQEVIKSEKWEFRKSETDTVIPEYTHIFTYAQQILPIIRLDKIKYRLNELLAPHCPLTVHDPNSDTDIEYVCIQPQQYEVIDKKQTSYVYDTAYKHMFENHIVYLPIVDNLGMFEVKHTTHVAGTYDDNLFFEELFYGPTISYKLFDAFKDLNSVTLYDVSDINAWDFACDYEDHYDEDGERIEPGDPKHPSNKQVNESTNVLVSNEEFFMESSKNPAVKARKRTVNNLRKLGVDRAHEVDDKKLKHGIDINVKDSYGDKRKTRISSNNIYPDAYVDELGTINITPETMNSNKFESTFNHEAGHLEQIKRKDYNTCDTKSKTTYVVSDKDSYPIKCAKLFLQKNAGKMNDHDRQWTELHADFLSCKKSGFGKMMKLIHSFKKSKQKIESACDELTKWNDNCCKKLVDLHSRYTVKDKAHGDYERPLTQEEVEDIFSLYNKSKEKLEHYRNILMERFYDLEDKSDEDNLSADYQKKLSKLMRKIFDKSKEISNKLQDFAEIYKHHGVNINNAQSFNVEMKLQLDSFNHQLRDCKSYSTTYDYRIKFIEDMKYIHDGHPGRCSIKYPTMTPEDKKYMQEADCILVSNEEFFAESSKHKNRMKKFIGSLDHVPTTEELKQMTTGRVDRESEPPIIDTDSERDVFENRKKQFKSQSPSEYVKHNTDKKLVDKDGKTLKEYTRREMESNADGLMSMGYADEGLDPNKIKSKNIKKTLKRMGYDPKTRTIESNIPDPKDPSKTIRTRLLIDDSTSKSMGAHASRNIENPTIGIPRKHLKFRNNAPLGIAAHENGHLYDQIHPEATADMHKAAKDEIERKHDDLLGVGRITDPDTGETIERSTSKPSPHFNPRERVADAIGLANTSKHTMRNDLEKSMRVFDDKGRSMDKFEKQLNNTRFAKEQLRNMDKDESLQEDLIKSANDDAESKYGSYRMDTLDPHKNVIGKPDTSKLTRESCLIMPNDEFFDLTE